MKANMGDWVEIENILLEPGSRAPQVPSDTQKVPLVERRKGYLLNDSAELGNEVEIKTIIGRKVKGKLSDINPRHKYDYGNPIKELIDVGIELRNEIELLERR
ncbi:2-amino-4-oxopentanoate thiolase subunit OrtA [Clostridium sp. Cult2]|uniref:2-amino-4-oxopentanoate thiolase subunit OrtA n=1 Tax=Clostridium sp. Cult2 TaxID=2079003 RepID=UPI001F25F88B|nr:2-amino-4-oxopentanoate thiolase subunit OrtA [Clostridium sp. Cult2]MCF6465419.1 2-amino-4-ketopentanoate thiolase [Clostridium sp. Cult2]